MNLYLIRHAEPANTSDDDPSLSNEGGKQAQKLGVMFQRIGLQTAGLAVLASEKRRAKQTAKMIYKSAFSMPAPLTLANPGGLDTAALMSLMRTVIADENASSLIMVWHLPAIGQAANFLLPDTNSLVWPTNYGATAHIRCADNTLPENTGTLRWLILPELLA